MEYRIEYQQGGLAPVKRLPDVKFHYVSEAIRAAEALEKALARVFVVAEDGRIEYDTFSGVKED